jgi:hypothetical protein
MLSISSGDALARALTMPLPDGIRDLLLLRREQLGEFAGSARFVVFLKRDTLSELEETLGFDVFVNGGDGTRHGDADYSPGFDLCVDHGHCFELTFELTTDFTHVVIVENAPGVHSDLLKFCAEYASEHV